MRTSGEDNDIQPKQWQSLIAINYPARKYGLNRFITINEAKKLCPNLILQHVATWKEGDEKWAYHPDAFAQIATHKVSLDPYRLESRRILACIKDVLPAPPMQRVEKASVDEVFLDLSSQIHSILVERYPEIAGPAPYDDATELLPRPPTTALDWNTDALVDLDSSETEDDDPDWDDIAMLVGSEIVRLVRAAIRERFKYTCSAGIARNKMIAKLGSAHRKPNQQTIIRNRAVQHFLGGFKFTKIRNLGGKLGEEVVSKFDTDQVKDLLSIPLEMIKSKIGDDTGSWVYGVIRGEDFSEVNSQTQIKSMLSAKSFRPTINTFEQAIRWIRIFVSDIFSRLLEEGVVENKRRPKTINLHHKQGAQMRSRQAPIPTGRSIDEALLFDIAKNLLGQVIIDGRAWPCSNLQLSVGGFQEGPNGNQGIDNFFLRGDEAKALKSSIPDSDDFESVVENGKLAKKRKTDGETIRKFFTKRERINESNEDWFHVCDSSTRTAPDTVLQEKSEYKYMDDDLTRKASNFPFKENQELRKTESDHLSIILKDSDSLQHLLSKSSLCDQCSKMIETADMEEHHDWHFAKLLQAQETIEPLCSSSRKLKKGLDGMNDATVELSTVNQGKKPKNGHTRGRTEKGQSRLVFGR